jgi:phosphoribosylformylglycinamidine synthase II
MEQRFEVRFKDDLKDVAGDQLAQRINRTIGKAVRCHFVEAYNLDAVLNGQDLSTLAADLFSDSVAQVCSFKEPMFLDLWRIEVGFLPGVTDNIGKTASSAIKDRLGKEVPVYYTRMYALGGEIDEFLCEQVSRLIHNPLIETCRIFPPEAEPAPYLPKVIIPKEPNVERFSLHMSEARFEIMAKERLLALSAEEFKAIKQYFKEEKIIESRKTVGLDNKMTDVELECLAQTWSEHCKHKIFNASITYEEDGDKHAINSLFKTFIRGSTEQVKKPYVVSVFKDNGGIIKFSPDYDIAVKVETHNAPSALDPYGGALTGILGVQRDVIGTGLGANPIANLDVLCFGYPDTPPKEVPKGVLHPSTIYEGVVLGIEHGGNKMGIPTVNGSIVFEKDYTTRPLVYCGTVGIMPTSINGRHTSDKQIKPGYLIVVAGGRIGKDGIHGATFSSMHIDASVPQSVVQIGDPITQKKVLDFTMQARDSLLYDAITDCGAGGLSSSVGELALLSGGCELELDKCPLKYPGLDPWEILLSESQERMTFAVPKENLEKLLALARLHDVEATVVGRFTGSGKFHCLYRGKSVAYLDMDFLHDGVPQLKLKASWKRLIYPEPRIEPFEPGSVLKRLLSSANITTKEKTIRRYDHEVKGMSVIKPIMLGPSDAAVLRPIYDSYEGLVVAHGICPRYVQDGYAMACLAFDEAVRNALCVGARFGYMAALDNFSWPDPIKSAKTPDGEQKLGALVRACLGLYDCSTGYSIPFISGKDSMKNDYYDGEHKYSIPPTLLVSMVGKIDDIRKAVSSEFKTPGAYVYILGITRDELGGSEFFKLFGGIGNIPPQLHQEETIPLYKAFSSAMGEGLVDSAHDVSDGGIAACFAECALGLSMGAELDLNFIKAETDKLESLLFSESAGRFIVTVTPEKVERFEKALAGTLFAKAGRVRGDKRFIIRKGPQDLINESVEEMREAYNKGI